ncbi:fungal-specific transcription factor domain-containing protein [Colletotrichum navitas]|uniref:Fungal-specific transcription factor domain-containing protein n=1 Tax=Colletotrichum navitas TaxID=681940 RepID=A0AAD8PXA7_9PEZI|nr:fungal-specific transcription factor domain-containing protein [Colletotrichum navitas]KAK1585498.1 fungal-specific transcription factor domain-containing protein [Colletotrichum navitas]
MAAEEEQPLPPPGDGDDGDDGDGDDGRRPGDSEQPPPAKKKRTRTRTGCLNCRRKKRKCDEGRPACGGCSRRKERCEWGIKVTFRAENAQTIRQDHPSMKKARRPPLRRQFEILDITDEVIRDYHLPPGFHDYDSDREMELDLSPPRAEAEAASGPQHEKDEAGYFDSPLSYSTSIAGSSTARRTLSSSGPSSAPAESVQTSAFAALLSPEARREDESANKVHPSTTDRIDFRASPTSASQLITDSAVANLIYLSQGGRCQVPHQHPTSTVHSMPPTALSMDHLMDPPFDFMDQIFTPEGSYEDGIFLPGSAYHELHSTLRNHLIQEVRSNGPTRHASPASAHTPRRRSGSGFIDASSGPSSSGEAAEAVDDLSSDHEPPCLPLEEECALWKNWVDEISPWLDKFDNQRHFQHSLPTMARSHNHLRYSMLALSARQLELKDKNRPTDQSLALYQEAIHLLLPQLPTRTTAVAASCVVLCVLEMASCSPKAWRRHLDGCASLMEAIGINGFVGGVEQALFWCFIRMDVCGGLISSVKTLIPVNHWASRVDLEADVALFLANPGHDMWANYAVYLCGQVLDLLAPLAKANPGGLFFDGPRNDMRHRVRWMKLWKYVEDWHSRRPPEMQHIMSIPSSDTVPFPKILYSNPAAISGNQLYHTASLLMLQNRPASLRLSPKPRSALWHARQICGISMTNHHHGAWTNSIQPLWIAGRCMSHPAEHRAILELLEKIERESGWGTKWRADDLKDFWGDLGDVPAAGEGVGAKRPRRHASIFRIGSNIEAMPTDS